MELVWIIEKKFHKITVIIAVVQNAIDMKIRMGLVTCEKWNPISKVKYGPIAEILMSL